MNANRAVKLVTGDEPACDEFEVEYAWYYLYDRDIIFYLPEFFQQAFLFALEHLDLDITVH